MLEQQSGEIRPEIGSTVDAGERPTSAPGSLHQRFDNLKRRIASHNRLDLVLHMALLIFLLRTGHSWYLELPVTCLCMLGILYRRVLRNDTYWFVFAVVLAAANFQDRYFIDNHQYMIVYLAVGIYCAFMTSSPAKTLAVTARYLIGFCFLFATVWKCISPDYLDGSFFHFTLVTDDRFHNAAQLASTLTKEELVQNQTLISQLKHGAESAGNIKLIDAPAIWPVSQFLTWWTIVIEGVIALAFLAPRKTFLHRYRDLALFAFLASTYAIAPVVGYGWVLATLGAAQTDDNAFYKRIIYVILFFLILVYVVPWATLAEGSLGIDLPFSK